MTRRALVIGWPVGHSKSPVMMNAAFAAAGIDAQMTAAAVPPEELATAIGAFRRDPDALGASVTVPHKVAIAALCDELASEARAIGAVNCLAFDGDRLVGHNTDAPGFADALAAAGFALRGKRAVLLGAGGAARAVAYGLRGGRAIEVVARRPDEVTWAAAWPWSDDQLRECFARADLVVDCTPTGLDPSADAAFAAALPLDALAPGAWVATLVYHRTTALLERARAAGHPTLDGRAMLVHQGARAFALWTGQPAPIDVMTAALAA